VTIHNALLSPPVAFIITFFVIASFSALLSKLSFKRKDRPADIGTSYACGEDVQSHLMQPDYAQFFPFAFFFTILHVIALMAATVPVETLDSLAIAVIYIAGAITGLFILFKR
jgi:hypothetical protein